MSRIGRGATAGAAPGSKAARSAEFWAVMMPCVAGGAAFERAERPWRAAAERHVTKLPFSRPFCTAIFKIFKGRMRVVCLACRRVFCQHNWPEQCRLLLLAPPWRAS